MIGVEVTFRFEADFDPALPRAVAEAAHTQFEGMPGLRSKVFTIDEENRQAVNFYLWDSEEAARAFFTDELRERVTGSTASRRRSSSSRSPPSSTTAEPGLVCRRCRTALRILRRSPHDREILAIALPALGALAAEPVYVLADTAIVGHLGVAPTGGARARRRRPLRALRDLQLPELRHHGAGGALRRRRAARRCRRGGRAGPLALPGDRLVLLVIAAAAAGPIVSVMGGSGRTGALRGHLSPDRSDRPAVRARHAGRARATSAASRTFGCRS